VEYRVVPHQGVVSDVGLQTFLNLQAQQGWHFAGSIFAAAQDGEPARMLVVLKRG
jgi:hypothetical protein